MPWWGWLLIAWAALSLGLAALEVRAGTLRSSWRMHWADGCAKPIVQSAFRGDGSPRNIIPRRGDDEVDELEHLLEHRQPGGRSAA